MVVRARVRMCNMCLRWPPQEYALRHIEFHAPSETRVNNVQFAFEMHFLLSTEGGDSMVRAMLFHSWPMPVET